MAKAAITDLKRRIEEVRRKAFSAGYSTAMKEVKNHASSAKPSTATGLMSSPNRRVSRRPARTRLTAPAPRTTRRRRSPQTNGRAAGVSARVGRSAARRSQRGTNAVLVAEVLKAAAPRALRQAEIRRALQDKGKIMSFPSIGYSLQQLVARNAARQVGNSKTWRHNKE